MIANSKYFLQIISVMVFSISIISMPNAYAKKNSNSLGGSHSVNGYVKKNGTYVQPHHATNPNQTQKDNWSSKPNVNPYTGKTGTKEAQK
ncbi:MAG: hypothetical protein WBJ38_07640 [Limnohabitans sp.]